MPTLFHRLILSNQLMMFIQMYKKYSRNFKEDMTFKTILMMWLDITVIFSLLQDNITNALFFHNIINSVF